MTDPTAASGRETPCWFHSIDGVASCGVHRNALRHTGINWRCETSGATFTFGTPFGAAASPLAGATEPEAEIAKSLEERLMDVWCAHDLVWKARFMVKHPDGLDPIIRLIRASAAPPPVSPPIVAGYDATFWHESYNMLRDAVTTHLDDCIRDDDVAEECILVEAIETAGKRLKSPASGPSGEMPTRREPGAGA